MSQEKKKTAYKVGEILIWLFYFVSPLYFIIHSVHFLGLTHPSPSFSKDKEEELLQIEKKSLNLPKYYLL